MRVNLSNEITILEPTEQVINWCEKNLIVTNPVYRQLKIQGKDDTIKIKHVPEKLSIHSKVRGNLKLPFGLLLPIWPYIREAERNIDFNETDNLSIINDEPVFKPFDYQEEAIDYMVKSKGGVLVSPCGSGKTFMGINIIKRIGKKALWICHTGDLLRQAEHDFKKLFPNVKIGLTTEGELNIGEDVTISTVQTLVKIDPELYKNEFETVVIDECVHCTSTPTQMKMFGSVISQIKARYKFGLTATPNRPDGMDKTMYAYIGCNRKGEFKQMYTVPRSAVKTITAEHVKVELNSGFDDWQMYKIVNRAGMIEYNKLMSGLVESEERTNKIIENILKCHKEGRKQVVLSHRIEHCETIVEKLKEQGVDALLCVGKISNKKRDDILKQRVKWDVIVATYQLLKEGISINELDTLHMTTPFKDGNTAVQCAGRVERYLENKKQPIVYDYVDVDIPYCEKRFVDRRRALKRRLKENG